MKISHRASPRNRSSRNSRPLTGERVTAGSGSAATLTCAGVAALPASGGSAIRSAMDVIWNRLNKAASALAQDHEPYRWIVPGLWSQASYEGFKLQRF